MDEVSAKKKKLSGADWLKIAGVGLVVVAAVLAIVFLLKGQTTVSGEFPDAETTQSITCEASGIDYPVALKYDGATGKDALVKVIFSRDKLASIALTYNIYYNSAEAIENGEAVNHAAMNLSYQAAGLGADAFNTKFSKLADSVKMNLYATSSMITGVAPKYFMLDAYNDEAGYTSQRVKTNYEGKGFSCVDNSK